jgi:hypothetical protein
VATATTTPSVRATIATSARASVDPVGTMNIRSRVVEMTVAEP